MRRLLVVMMCALSLSVIGLNSCGSAFEKQSNSSSENVENKHLSEQPLKRKTILWREWCTLLCDLNTAFVSKDVEKWNSLHSRLIEVERQLGGFEAVVDLRLTDNCACDRSDSFLEQYAMRICGLFDEGDFSAALAAGTFVLLEFSSDDQRKIDDLVQKYCPE